MTHAVTDIQRFCMHDGPGLRTTVFLKGCPLRCFWCHNPETQKEAPQVLYHEARCIGCGGCVPACPQGAHAVDPAHRFDRATCSGCGVCAEACPTGALKLVGNRMTSEEIIDIALRDKAFYGETGGITLSGGEPMMHPKACIELLTLAKEKGLHTAVETCGYFSPEWVEPLAKVADVVLFDVKDTDDTRHRQNTGVSNARILDNLHALDRLGVPIILRCLLLKGVNLNETHLRAVRDLFLSLQNGVKPELLACHSLGGSKEQALGQPVTPLAEYEPTADEMAWARRFVAQV